MFFIGFIMDLLLWLGLSEDEWFWVISKVIVGELLVLVVLFIVL